MKPNIWSMNKDVSIKTLLLLLESHFEHGGYDIASRPEDDFRSIRLTPPEPDDSETDNSVVNNVELYIYTYGQQEDHYGVHIEYPNLIETNYSDTVEILENISFEQLANIIAINFGAV